MLLLLLLRGMTAADCGPATIMPPPPPMWRSGPPLAAVSLMSCAVSQTAEQQTANLQDSCWEHC